MNFICLRIKKNHLHVDDDFARRLALKQRLGTTQKGPIPDFYRHFIIIKIAGNPVSQLHNSLHAFTRHLFVFQSFRQSNPSCHQLFDPLWAQMSQ